MPGDPLAQFTALAVLLDYVLEQVEKKRRPQGRYALWLNQRGRYVKRRLGIFLMRIGGKLVYEGSTL
jgi:hypothetical protein